MSTGRWTDAGSLVQPRLAFDLSVTPAGVVASGGTADNRGLDSVEIFDPAKGVCRRGPKLDGQRLHHAGAVVNGKLVVAGGKRERVADHVGRRSRRRGAAVEDGRVARGGANRCYAS